MHTSLEQLPEDTRMHVLDNGFIIVSEDVLCDVLRVKIEDFESGEVAGDGKMQPLAETFQAQNSSEGKV